MEERQFLKVKRAPHCFCKILGGHGSVVPQFVCMYKTKIHKNITQHEQRGWVILKRVIKPDFIIVQPLVLKKLKTD